MPYATNPIDGVRVFFEDAGGSGPPVLVYAGFSDPVEYMENTGLAAGLRDDRRLIFADHRGQGRSEKPHAVASYALQTRVADAVAVLDRLEIERTHFIGLSWGARFGFAIGEHAPDRLLSLALIGNQPYEWELSGPIYQPVAAAISAGVKHGVVAFVEQWERGIGERFPEPARTWMLDNDPIALDAAFRSAALEGRISEDLAAWRIPCLIAVGADDPMHDDAARGAAEIPGARFVSLPGETHYSADRATDVLLPAVRELFRSSTRRTASG